jgi:hypothetical protein
VGHVGGRACGSTVASWVRLVRCCARVAGRRILAADAATEEKADLLDDFVSIIYNCLPVRTAVGAAPDR